MASPRSVRCQGNRGQAHLLSPPPEALAAGVGSIGRDEVDQLLDPADAAPARGRSRCARGPGCAAPTRSRCRPPSPAAGRRPLPVLALGHRRPGLDADDRRLHRLPDVDVGVADDQGVLAGDLLGDPRLLRARARGGRPARRAAVPPWAGTRGRSPAGRRRRAAARRRRPRCAGRGPRPSRPARRRACPRRRSGPRGPPGRGRRRRRSSPEALRVRPGGRGLLRPHQDDRPAVDPEAGPERVARDLARTGPRGGRRPSRSGRRRRRTRSWGPRRRGRCSASTCGTGFFSVRGWTRLSYGERGGTPTLGTPCAVRARRAGGPAVSSRCQARDSTRPVPAEARIVIARQRRAVRAAAPVVWQPLDV